MSEIRLYVDEDASEHAVVQGLRLRGIDILTTLEAGNSRASDDEQLAFAISQQRAIYTFNVGDFGKLHRDYLAKSSEHHGIIVIPDQRYSVGEKIRRVAELLRRLSAEEMLNRMEYL